MKRVLGLILAGGQGERLSILSAERAKPAVPFAGKYRIIDFVLSNCVNSGVTDVAVLTQYRPRSLNDHIGIGRPWDLDRYNRGVRLLQPYLSRKNADWYKGTADAVYQNLYVVEESRAQLVLILGGDHIYKMDYQEMVTAHEKSGADVTVAVREVPIEEAHRFGIITVNENNEVLSFVEKPRNPTSNLVSMGIYVFNKQVLVERLQEDAYSESHHDFGKDVLPKMVGRDRVFAFEYKGYWQDVGTIQTYWESNMDLLAEPAPLNLYDDWVIHTKSEERPPAKIVNPGRVVNSLVSNGCVIEGTVERSVLSPGVRIMPGAIVRDSIIMTDAVIGRNAFLDRVIVDKEAVVGYNSLVGYGDDNTPNQSEPERLNTGITIIGKRARVPSNARIGRNCIIGPNVRESDFEEVVLESGTTLEARVARPVLLV
jgi:glucose-1-phosphate adenylyltransferase